MGKSSKGKNIWFERELLESKAYLALKTATAYKVLALFWIKRQFMKLGRSGKKEWNIINNGEIEFTYKEAKNKLGISEATFKNAIDELREKGFINIAFTGMGVHKVKNLYEICNRWRKYGTDEYNPPKPRRKGPINRGFQKGNRLGRNCTKEI